MLDGRGCSAVTTRNYFNPCKSEAAGYKAKILNPYLILASWNMTLGWCWCLNWPITRLKRERWTKIVKIVYRGNCVNNKWLRLPPIIMYEVWSVQQFQISDYEKLFYIKIAPAWWPPSCVTTDVPVANKTVYLKYISISYLLFAFYIDRKI